MTDGSSGKDTAKDPTPEAKAFEEGLKKILKTPKTEVDKRLAEQRRKKNLKTT